MRVKWHCSGNKPQMGDLRLQEKNNDERLKYNW